MKPVQSTAIAFASGCALGIVFGIPPFYLIPLLLISVSVWAVPKFDHLPRHMLFFLIAGMILVSYTRAGTQEFPVSGSKYAVKGTVTFVRESNARRSVFEMKIEEANPSGLPLTIARCYTLQNDKLQSGDVIEFTASTRTPATATNPGEFDFAQYLMTNDVGVMLASYETPRIIGSKVSPSVVADRVRSAFDSVFVSNLPQRQADLLDSMVFGRRELPDDISRNFSRTGTSHIVAASGFNISIVTITMLYLMLWLTGNKKAALICAIVIAICYAMIAGFSPSVSRALLMAVLSIGAQLFNRRHATSSGLALSVIILLAINPLWIAQPGFQLSFLSTLCLFVIAPVLFELEKNKPWPFKILTLILITTVIQLLALPVLATNFHSISLVSPIANLIVIPISTLLTPLGLLASVFGVILPPIGTLLCLIAYPILIILDKAIEILAQPSWALLSIGNVSAYAWIFYYISAGFGLALITKAKAFTQRNMKLVAVTVIAISLSAFCGTVSSTPSNNGQITFLDVGHGDAIFIQTPSGKTLLIDGGGGAPYLPSGDTGARIVIPFLRFRGINHLDYIIATHRDQDHIGGLTSVINEFPVGEIFDSGVKSDTFEARDFELSIKNKRIRATIPSPRQEVQIDPKTKIIFLGPPNPLNPGQTKADITNNNSIACIFEMDGVRILFGADIQTEAMVQEIGLGSLIKADIVKIPHHGGYTPGFPRWIDQVQPKLLVNSDSANDGTGIDTRIEKSILERYIPVVSTANIGAITISIDKGTWMVEGFTRK